MHSKHSAIFKMNSPFLRVELKDGEGDSVLFLDERNRENEWLIQNNVGGYGGWYKIIFVEIRGKTYRVYLTRDCQALDLLLACEERWNLQNPRLYYHGDEVMRDKWLGNVINGASFLIQEDGDEKRTPFYVNKFESVKTMKKDSGDIGQDEEKFKVTEIADVNLDLQLSRSSNEEDEKSHEVSLPSSWAPQGLNLDLTEPTLPLTTDSPTNINLSFDDSLLNTPNDTLPEAQLGMPDIDFLFHGGQLPEMTEVEALANRLAEVNHMLPPVPTDNQQDLVMGFPIDHFERMGFRMPEPQQLIPRPVSPILDHEPTKHDTKPDKVTTKMVTRAVEDAINRARMNEDIDMNVVITVDDDSDFEEVSKKKKKRGKKKKKKISTKEWAQNLEDAISTPKKEVPNAGYEEEQDIVPPLTPSPIQLPDRKMNKDGKLQRKLNWSVEEKVKMLTTVCLKMERTSEGYNVDGMKHLKYVFKLISPKAETDPEHSRLWGDFIAYYWRTGHPADSSQSGGGMHTFLKEQCDAIGQKFTQATLRRNLKKFVEEYQRQLNSKQRAKRKKPDK